jgi:hypothetical protein
MVKLESPIATKVEISNVLIQTFSELVIPVLLLFCLQNFFYTKQRCLRSDFLSKHRSLNKLFFSFKKDKTLSLLYTMS